MRCTVLPVSTRTMETTIVPTLRPSRKPDLRDRSGQRERGVQAEQPEQPEPDH